MWGVKGLFASLQGLVEGCPERRHPPKDHMVRAKCNPLPGCRNSTCKGPEVEVRLSLLEKVERKCGWC